MYNFIKKKKGDMSTCHLKFNSHLEIMVGRDYLFEIK
jgi:hypothetical protein